MNVKNEENADLFQCSNCHLLTTVIKTKIYFSRLCLHRLCESCNKKVFSPENSIYICNFCQRPHEAKDYSDKTRDESYYEYDIITRHKIMAV